MISCLLWLDLNAKLHVDKRRSQDEINSLERAFELKLLLSMIVVRNRWRMSGYILKTLQYILFTVKKFKTIQSVHIMAVALIALGLLLFHEAFLWKASYQPYPYTCHCIPIYLCLFHYMSVWDFNIYVIYLTHMRPVFAWIINLYNSDKVSCPVMHTAQ